MEINNCCFCEEAKSQLIQKDFKENTKYENRIVLQSDYFFALVTVSPIREGHVLIVPKKHHKGLMQSDSLEYADFKRFFYKVKRMLDAKYGTTVYFEHGVGSNIVDGGCGIDHAHVHLLPASHNEINNLISDIRSDFDLGLLSMDEIKKRTLNQSSYLMLGIDLDAVSYCWSESIKSQYLRKKVCKALNLPESDWRDLTNWNGFNKTLDVLMHA